MVNLERYTQYDLFEPKKSFGLRSCVTWQAIFYIQSNGRRHGKFGQICPMHYCFLSNQFILWTQK